jgi:chemotaxis response regulator CheB
MNNDHLDPIFADRYEAIFDNSDHDNKEQMNWTFKHVLDPLAQAVTELLEETLPEERNFPLFEGEGEESLAVAIAITNRTLRELNASDDVLPLDRVMDAEDYLHLANFALACRHMRAVCADEAYGEGARQALRAFSNRLAVDYIPIEQMMVTRAKAKVSVVEQLRERALVARQNQEPSRGATLEELLAPRTPEQQAKLDKMVNDWLDHE